MTSTPPHSNRRKNGRSYHSLKTAHAYSVENELQAKNHLPASNLEQGWVIDSGASAHMTVGRVGGQSFLYFGLHSDYVSERY